MFTALILTLWASPAIAWRSALTMSIRRSAHCNGDSQAQQIQMANEVSRRQWSTRAAAAVGAVVYASPNSASAAPALFGGDGDGDGEKATATLARAVVTTSDLDTSVKFWTQGLGMKVLRRPDATSAIVAYGAEVTAAAGDAGCFALELRERSTVGVGRRAGGAGGLGNGIAYLELVLPDSSNMISYRTQEAGGEIEPHWFAEKSFVDVRSPEGLACRVTRGDAVKKGERRDPIVELALNVRDPRAAADFYGVRGLGLRERDGILDGVLASSPLGDGAIRLDSSRPTGSGGSGGGITLALLPASFGSKIVIGDVFSRLELVGQDPAAAARRVAAIDADAGVAPPPPPPPPPAVADAASSTDVTAAPPSADATEAVVAPPASTGKMVQLRDPDGRFVACSATA